MLHLCIIERCTTIVFGVGPCVEHEPRRVPLAEQLLAEAVAAAQQEQANAEAAASRAESSSQE
jgi:hypothetical protein